jgi:hypothetical protein
LTANRHRREEPGERTEAAGQAVQISKWVLWEAFQGVKANKGAAGQVRQRLGEEGAVAGEVEPDGAHAVQVGDVEPGVGQELPERVLEKIVDLERAPAPSVLMRPTPRTAARSGETV